MTEAEILREMKIFFLYFSRITSLILVLPIFGMKGKVKIMKVGLGLALTVIVYAVRYPSPLADVTNSAYALLVIQAVGTGLFIGFAVYMVVYGLKMAGGLIGLEMGLNFARQADPLTGQSVPLLANFYETLIVLVFLSLHGHHWVLLMLNRSFDALPVGMFFFDGKIVVWLFTMLKYVYEVSVSIVAPIFIILLLISVGIGLIAKNIPQINILEVGFPLRILVGVSLMAFFLVHLNGILVSVFRFFQEKLFGLFSFI